MEEIVSVTVTAPDTDWLADFTRAIVADRLVASGNTVPAVRSIFRWEGVIKDESESLVILHKRQSLVPELVERVKASHPYTTPEVLAVTISSAKGG